MLEKYEKKGRPCALLRSPLHITVYQLLLKLQTDLHAVVAAEEGTEGRDCAVAGKLTKRAGILQQFADIHNDEQVIAVELSSTDELLQTGRVSQDNLLARCSVSAGQGLPAESLGEVAVLIECHLHLTLPDAELRELRLELLLNGSASHLAADILQRIVRLEHDSRLSILPCAYELIGSGNLVLIEDCRQSRSHAAAGAAGDAREDSAEDIL